MKTFLRLIGGTLIGACIGLIIVIPFIAVIDGVSLTSAARGVFSKFSFSDVAYIVWMLVAAVIALVLNIVLHEGGHLVAGLLTGYRFVSFRFFNWTLIRQGGRLHWRNYELAGTGGQCLMAPPDKPLEQIDTRRYNAGGVLANCIVALLSLWLIWVFDLPRWLDILLIMMIVIALFTVLTNGIPMKVGGVANDGLNLVQMEKDLPGKHCFCNILEVNARIQEGETYNEMPDRLFDMPQPIDWKNSMHVGSALLAATRMTALYQWEDAYRLLTEALTHKDDIMALYQMELENMMTLTCIATGRDEEARQHYSPDVAQHISRHASTQSDKRLTAMAVALALDGDRNKAEKMLHQLEADRDKYIHQGDVAMSLDLMQWLLNEKEKTINTTNTN